MFFLHPDRSAELDDRSRIRVAVLGDRHDILVGSANWSAPKEPFGRCVLALATRLRRAGARTFKVLDIFLTPRSVKMSSPRCDGTKSSISLADARGA